MAVRTINSVRNPKWANYAQTLIDMEVDFDELDDEFVPFTANLNDSEEYSVELYNNAVNGDYGDIAAFEIPTNITGDEAQDWIRGIRNRLLEETDYIEMPTKWSSLTAEKQAEWTAYRNALRDMPADNLTAELVWNDDYTNMSWNNLTIPTKPE